GAISGVAESNHSAASSASRASSSLQRRNFARSGAARRPKRPKAAPLQGAIRVADSLPRLLQFSLVPSPWATLPKKGVEGQSLRRGRPTTACIALRPYRERGGLTLNYIAAGAPSSPPRVSETPLDDT